MHDVASTIAFKRKQIASLAEIGTEAAAAATQRLNAEIAALDATSPEGVAAAAAVAAAAPAPVVDPALASRLSSAESAIADLRARLTVLEILAAPQGG